MYYEQMCTAYTSSECVSYVTSCAFSPAHFSCMYQRKFCGAGYWAPNYAPFRSKYKLARVCVCVCLVRRVRADTVSSRHHTRVRSSINLRDITGAMKYHPYIVLRFKKSCDARTYIHDAGEIRTCPTGSNCPLYDRFGIVPTIVYI